MLMRVKTDYVVSLTLARKGSKGLPGKNLMKLGEHPLISYSFAASRLSKRINKSYFSSDCDEMIDLAKMCNIHVPFVRPAKFATDTSTDYDVIQHFLMWHDEKFSFIPEYIVQLRPTLPFRRVQWIDECVELALTQNYSCVRSIFEVTETPFKMWCKSEDDTICPFVQVTDNVEHYNLPRQLLPKVYYHSGHVDVINCDMVMKAKTLTGQKIHGYEVPKHTYVDIDRKSDFDFAQQNLDILCDSEIRDYLCKQHFNTHG